MKIAPISEALNIPDTHDTRELAERLLAIRGISEACAQLNLNEQLVILCKYWLNLGQKETAYVYGVTPPRIGQIEAKAIRKLRHFTKRHLYFGSQCAQDAIDADLRTQREQREQERAYYQAYLQKEEERRLLEKERQHKLRLKEEQRLKDLYEQNERALKEEEAQRARWQLDADRDWQKNAPKRHPIPPPFITLTYVAGFPCLYCPPHHGTVRRELHPELYDQWLAYLITKQHNK